MLGIGIGSSKTRGKKVKSKVYQKQGKDGIRNGLLLKQNTGGKSRAAEERKDSVALGLGRLLLTS